MLPLFFKQTFTRLCINRTGNYSVMMRLDNTIPQLLPMCGRIIKMYQWISYVKTFIEENEEIPPEMSGRWINLVQKVNEDSSGPSLDQPNQRVENKDNSEVNRHDKIMLELSQI